MACISCPEPQPAKWIHSLNSINIHFESDYLLNEYDNAPNPLNVCIYQLSDIAPFEQKIQDNEAIRDLVNCKSFDNAVKFKEEEVIYPSKKGVIKLDRYKDVQYVGIVSAYTNHFLNPNLSPEDRITKVFKVECLKHCKGWINPVSQLIPQTLNIYLYFDKDRILTINKPDPKDLKKKLFMDTFDSTQKQIKTEKDTIQSGDKVYKDNKDSYNTIKDLFDQ